MEIILVVLAIAAVVGAVLWNHRNAALAMAGESFGLDEPPDAVVRAVGDAYCGGAKAAVKAFVWRLTVSRSGASSFQVVSTIGDVGHIHVRPDAHGGSVVETSTDELYVGSHPMTHSRRPGLWGFATAISHVVYKMLGITPNAARMKRFQRGVERRVRRQLRKSQPTPR